METKNASLVLYDDKCYLCTKFAKIVNFLSKGNLSIIGHYSAKGEEIRSDVLDESALEMFWVIEEKTAYGGRAALFPLIKAIIRAKTRKNNSLIFDANCNQECKTVKSVFVRSASILTNSRRIELK